MLRLERLLVEAIFFGVGVTLAAPRAVPCLGGWHLPQLQHRRHHHGWAGDSAKASTIHPAHTPV